MLRCALVCVYTYLYVVRERGVECRARGNSDSRAAAGLCWCLIGARGGWRGPDGFSCWSLKKFGRAGEHGNFACRYSKVKGGQRGRGSPVRPVWRAAESAGPLYAHFCFFYNPRVNIHSRVFSHT